MRRLEPELPLWSRFYGLHPWDIERMPVRLISEYRVRMHDLQAQGADLWQVQPPQQ